MKISIERIEGEFVVVKLPNGELKICPIEMFPEELKIGDIVEIKILE